MSKSIVVSTRHLEQAGAQIRRQPHPLEILKEQEPDLAAYLSERLVELDHALDDLCAPRENTRIVFRRFEFLLLTCIDAQREAYLAHAAAARSAADLSHSSAALHIQGASLTLTCSSNASPV